MLYTKKADREGDTGKRWGWGKGRRYQGSQGHDRFVNRRLVERVGCGMRIGFITGAWGDTGEICWGLLRNAKLFSFLYIYRLPPS